MNELITAISEALDKRPWAVSECVMRLEESRMSLWISGGKDKLKVWEPAEVELSDEAKDLLWPKVELVIGNLTTHQQEWKRRREQTVLDSIVGKPVTDGVAPF